MEPKPVTECKTPSYPTRREILTGAATFALTSFAGCWRVLGETAQGKAIVAPVFEHGTGRGATGCVVISPPVFLSEEEAMQIIREELAKHGIRLKDGGVLKGVRLFHRISLEDGKNVSRIEEINVEDDPEWQAMYEEQPELKQEFDEMKQRSTPKPLKLDGVDAEKKVAVEFISESDYCDSGGLLNTSTVQDYDFVDVAKYVAEKAERESKDPIYVGVFYDPLVKPPKPDFSIKLSKKEQEAAWKKRDADAKEESKRLLREQVDDFAGWLKEKKVVP
jgi:hypothetical protein